MIGKMLWHTVLDKGLYATARKEDVYGKNHQFHH